MINSIQVGGEATSEIIAYDSKTKKIFVVNPEKSEITIYDISNLNNISKLPSINIPDGSPNSVDVYNGQLAVAIEASNKQAPGYIRVFNTESQALSDEFQVGALPDMVIFSPNSQLLVSANEGEPSDDYSVDPLGTVSIIKLSTKEVTTLDFSGFESQKDQLMQDGLRIFGPNASLAQDIEPEYVTISHNSNYAFVSLQENNGMAKIDLQSKTIVDIFPLGFKNYNLEGNEIDPSDRDNIKILNTWPVYGMFQPDAIKSVKIAGSEYIFAANEGDARDYDTFSEEARVEDIQLDPAIFPVGIEAEDQLGRLEITTTLGDADMDGLYEELYSYGALSFSIYNTQGERLYDSGNEIGARTLALTPDRFNDDDGRSDA